jgi:hypothetical protein
MLLMEQLRHWPAQAGDLSPQAIYMGGNPIFILNTGKMEPVTTYI